MNKEEEIENVVRQINKDMETLSRVLMLPIYNYEPKEECIWEYYEEDYNGFYKTACGEDIFHLNFIDGTQYCCFCGKHLEIK